MLACYEPSSFKLHHTGTQQEVFLSELAQGVLPQP